MDNKNYKLLFFIVLSILIVFLSISTIFIIVNKTNKDNKINSSEKKKEKINEDKKDNQIEDIEKKDNYNNEKSEDISIINSYDDLEITSIDEEVLSYIKLKSNEIDSKIEEKNYEDKAKKFFIELVDFIFYDGKIKNHTFSELTNKAKIEVVKITLKLEDKIEEHYPGLIDTMEEKYSNIKSKLINLYNDKIEDFCYEHNNLCVEVKEDYETIKKSLKNFFNKTKNKISNFYQAKIKNN